MLTGANSIVVSVQDFMGSILAGLLELTKNFTVLGIVACKFEFSKQCKIEFDLEFCFNTNNNLLLAHTVILILLLHV